MNRFRNTRIFYILRYIKRNPLFLFNKSFYKLLARIINLKSLSKKLKNKDILYIFDDVFPCDLSSFRYTEYQHYFKEFENVIVLTTGTSLPALKVNDTIEEIIDKYQKKYKDRKDKFIILPLNNIEKRFLKKITKNANKNLAIITFIQNVINSYHNNLILLEEYSIPFVFTLYPGGGFALNNENSDEILRKAMSSKLFKKVIVTQQVTRRYLLEKKLCRSDKIKMIYGVVTSPKQLNVDIRNKIYYSKEKDTLDICFCAYKYMEKGLDKGYDLFINIAKKLVNKYKNIKFHVVGPFDESDINVSDIKENITFYGPQRTDWFMDFYKDKDIFISLNRSSLLSKGAFDGFPTASASEAMLNGLLLIASDELKQNIKFTPDKDIIITDLDATKVAKTIEYFYLNKQKIKEIATSGCKKAKKIYSLEKQVYERSNLLKEIMKEKTNK